MTNIQKLRRILTAEVNELEEYIRRANHRETFYLDGKLQALRATIEKIDELER